jgi:hypothetical protein
MSNKGATEAVSAKEITTGFGSNGEGGFECELNKRIHQCQLT